MVAPLKPDVAPEETHQGLEYLLAAFALAAEFVAVAIGEAWLGWAPALLFFGAFHEYTKSFLNRKRKLVRWGGRILTAVVLVIATRQVINVMEKHIRARMITAPALQFAVTADKVLVIDNSKGASALQDFQVTAIEYHLDPTAFVNNHATIANRNQIGGDLDFTHFDVKARETKRINLNEGRYGFTLRMHQVPGMEEFDSQIHYFCLRFKFTKQDTGETFVHYLVISPYTNSFDFAEHPESAAGSTTGSEGFPFSIVRIIKADARTVYGTEYREYQP